MSLLGQRESGLVGFVASADGVHDVAGLVVGQVPVVGQVLVNPEQERIPLPSSLAYLLDRHVAGVLPARSYQVEPGTQYASARGRREDPHLHSLLVLQVDGAVPRTGD